MGHPENGRGKQKKCKKTIEKQAVVEYRSNLGEIFFAVSSPDQYLRSLTKPESNHVNSKIKYSSDGRSAQSHFAYTPQECGVGYINNILRHKCKNDGVRYFEDIFGRIHWINLKMRQIITNDKHCIVVLQR